MKKLFTMLCCFAGIQYSASAQNILSLQTATIEGATVITPTMSNLLALMKAPKSDFIATMSNLNYKQSKPDDANTFQANTAVQIYNVDKEEKNIDIFFSDHASYAKSVKDAFLTQYPNATHKSMDSGIEAYYFDPNDGSGLNYCIFFDLPADGGGGVTLLQLDK